MASIASPYDEANKKRRRSALDDNIWDTAADAVLFDSDENDLITGPRVMRVFVVADDLSLYNFDNIFLPGHSHAEECIEAFYTHDDNGQYNHEMEGQYTVSFHQCNSFADCKSDPFYQPVGVTHVNSYTSEFIEQGHKYLLHRHTQHATSQDDSHSSELNASVIALSKSMKKMQLSEARVEVTCRLTQEQMSTAINLLNDFLYELHNLNIQGVMAIPFINNSKNPLPVKVSSEQKMRIMALTRIIRDRLTIGHDNNTIRELKYITEEIYAIYAHPMRALERDLDRLCEYTNLSPLAIGVETTPLCIAYGPFSEGDIDWNVCGSINDGEGRFISSRFRRDTDGLLDSQIKFECTGDEGIKIILYTEDMGKCHTFSMKSITSLSFSSELTLYIAICKLFRKFYEDLSMVVICTKGFSDRNMRAFITCMKRNFPEAVIVALVDLDLYGQRMIQANHHTESLTRPNHHLRDRLESNYSYDSFWLGPHPSNVTYLREQGHKISSTPMKDNIKRDLERFIKFSAFPCCGNQERSGEREKELKLFLNNEEIVKMEQIPPHVFVDYFCDKLKRGDYGI